MKSIIKSLSCITVFSNILADETVKGFIDFLECDKGGNEQLKKYCSFVSKLYKSGCDLSKHILRLVLEDENEYVVMLSQNREVPECMRNAVNRELKSFTELSRLTAKEIAATLEAEYDDIPLFDNSETDFVFLYEKKLSRLSKDGYGIFSKYSMFNLTANGEIAPLKAADRINVDELIGYENERQKVIDNTVALLSGKPAANILLCGDAGTGKSSTVKAVVNLLAKEGVRLIEVRKDQLMSLPLVMEEIDRNPLKFIIFIDDLSFNSAEEGLGTLKAILEGSAAARADNAVIYATSNRRHLVKETFSDRDGDDVHRADTMQELISLSERFGLTIQYSKPNKELYLRIVKSLAEKRSLDIDQSKLYIEAEAFALRKGGRSARAARQFVDSLCAR